MSINPLDLAALSRLLDNVLELPTVGREAWLQTLPEADRRLIPMLRDMLRDHDSHPPQGGFLSSGPAFEALPADDEIASAGERIGPYRLVRELGRGGMGAVWLADRADGNFKRQVALKLPHLAWGGGLVERMAREREIGALLEHPNIARLYDAGVDERGRPYLALEYIDGETLDVWCKRQSLSVRERLKLVVQVARAVAYAHARLVVHRDLKPSNVIVSPDGQTHLLDFGIAKLLHDATPGEPGLTQELGRVLTPHFASPEQLRGGAITVQSDVYSLAVLSYELLTGTTPYKPDRKTLGALEEAILRSEPALASSRALDAATARQLKGELDAILAMALKREPGERYATVDAFANDIERLLNGEVVLAQPDSLGYRTSKLLQRNRLAFGAAAAVLFAVIAGAGVSVAQARNAYEAAERAEVVKAFVVDLFKANSRESPANKQLRQLPAELLLERGAKLIETRFAKQPALQAELYGVVGGIFADVGANELAATYAERQVRLLADNGAPRAEQARANLLLTEILFVDRKMSAANSAGKRALEMAEGDAALRPRALVLMTRVLRRQGLDDEAEVMLKRAEGELQGSGGPTALSARVKAIRAATLTDKNRFEDALALYRSAIDEAVTAEGALSPVAIDLRLEVARGLISQGRGTDSAAYSEAALAALRETGGASDVRAALEESNIAAAKNDMGQLAAEPAKTAIEHALGVLNGHGSLVPESIKALVEFDLGRVYATWGDAQRADDLISRVAKSLRSRVEGPTVLFHLASYQGLVAMYAGRHEEADRFSRERIANRKLLGSSRHPYAISDHTAAAFNLGMSRRYQQAEELLAAAGRIDLPLATAGVTPTYIALIPKMRARISLMKGDASSALAQLLPEDKDEEDMFPFNAVLLRGEILCAVGRREEGLSRLERTLKTMEQRDHRLHPELARARAVTGLCALAHGQRERAAALNALARDALRAQATVSSYFSAPSDQLERLLAKGANGTADPRAAPFARLK